MREHGWVVYVWVFLVVQVLSAVGRLVLFFKKPGAVSKLDLFESVVGLAAMPALFGFAYAKPYGRHLFWMAFAACFLALNVYSLCTPKMRELYGKRWQVSAGSLVAMVVTGGPALWALVSYAYFDPAVWGS